MAGRRAVRPERALTGPPAGSARARGGLRVEPAVLAAGLADALHRAGLPVGPERAGRFARALSLLPPADRARLYWTARVALVSDREQLPAFDRVFAAVFAADHDPADGRGDPAAPPAVRSPARPRPGPLSLVDGSAPAPAGAPAGRPDEAGDPADRADPGAGGVARGTAAPDVVHRAGAGGGGRGAPAGPPAGAGDPAADDAAHQGVAAGRRPGRPAPQRAPRAADRR